MAEEKQCGLFGISYPSPAKLPLGNRNTFLLHSPPMIFVDRSFFSFCKRLFFPLLLYFVGLFCSGLFICASRYSLSRRNNSHFSQSLFYRSFSFSTTRRIVVMWTFLCFLCTTSPVELYGLKLCLVSCPSSLSWVLGMLKEVRQWDYLSLEGLETGSEQNFGEHFRAVASIPEVRHTSLLFLLCYTRCRTGVCCMLAHRHPLRITILMFCYIQSSIRAVLTPCRSLILVWRLGLSFCNYFTGGVFWQFPLL